MRKSHVRPTDLSLAPFLLFALPWYLVSLIAVRILHAAGHFLGGMSGGARPIGLWIGLAGGDTAWLNYPNAAWSGRWASLPYHLGGALAVLLIGVLLAWFWPPAFRVGWRLLPLLFGAVGFAHGVAEPLLNLDDRSEAGLAADLLGVPVEAIAGAGLILGLVLVCLAVSRMANLSAMVAGTRSSGRRMVFILLVWTLPGLVYVGARVVVSGFDLVPIVGLLVLATAPAIFLARPVDRSFFQKVNRDGLGAVIAIGIALSLVGLGSWLWIFGGVGAGSQGVLWSKPGVSNNVRAETPAHRLPSLVQPPGSR